MKKFMTCLIICGFTCIVYTKLISVTELINFDRTAKVEMTKENSITEALYSSIPSDLIHISTEQIGLFIKQISLK